MIVISVPTDEIVEFKKDDKGDVTAITMTPPWGNYFEQNTQQMQQSLSNEGFWIPSVSSANSSVSPPAAGGQLAQIAASYGQQTGVNLGTLVYDPNTNQLKVLLSDSPTTASFHAITTS